jgi:hypothetical protein
VASKNGKKPSFKSKKTCKITTNMLFEVSAGQGMIIPRAVIQNTAGGFKDPFGPEKRLKRRVEVRC